MLLLALYPLLPESPHYLAVQGRMQEARAVLDRIARRNRRPLPPGELVADSLRTPEGASHALRPFAPRPLTLTLTLNPMVCDHFCASRAAVCVECCAVKGGAGVEMCCFGHWGRWHSRQGTRYGQAAGPCLRGQQAVRAQRYCEGFVR